ncbi:MAG: hypothetical protein A1D16_00070 [Flavihumibacter sp. CACIAM 22H1]|nr:MAG: hypothetical protein A1D16_00070 [Flavihumibacter sp. CACIAM 22H1]
MNKIFASAIALLSTLTAFSQNVFPSTGNVGIGTTSATSPLHIYGYDWDKITLEEIGTTGIGRMQFKNSGNTYYVGTVASTFGNYGHVRPNTAFNTYDGSNGINLAAVHYDASIRFYTGGGDDANERFRIGNTGKIFGLSVTRDASIRDSVLTMDPSTKELQVTPLKPSKMNFVDTRTVSTSPTNYNGAFQTHLKNNSSLGLSPVGSGLSSTVGFRGGAGDATGKSHELAFTDNNQVWFRSGFDAAWGGWKKLVLDSAGTVRLGTTSDRATLHVNGDVVTRKVKVTQNNWPDYVFGSGYLLRSLYEVEVFIQKYHHLPEIPSAAEIDEKGLDIGETQALLLKKIEELTLYAIEQQKQIDALVLQNELLLKNLKSKKKRKVSLLSSN